MPLWLNTLPDNKPRNDWGHPVVLYWLAFGMSPEWLRLWGFVLPEAPTREAQS